MGISTIRSALSFLIPGGLLFALMAIGAEVSASARWLAAAGELFFYVAAVVALLLGWRFDRSRLIFATVVLGLGGWLLHGVANRHDVLMRLVPLAVALLLPPNIALVGMAKERGIFTWHGLIRWSVIGVQPVLFWILLHFERYDWLGVLDARLIPTHLLSNLRMEQPALLAFMLAMVIIGYQCFRERNAMMNGLFWALCLVGYGLLRSPSLPLTLAFFGGALLILIAAVIETSHSMAFRDELTGLPARRALNQSLLKLGSRYTIAMLDVDHFKKFNDTYGHDVGDQVLKMVAARVGEVKGGGKPFRYGGEEFTVVFPGKGGEEALPHLERLRAAIADGGFTVRGPDRPREKGTNSRKGSEKRVQITISIGVAERQGDQRDPHEVIKAADKALYRAKSAGRNRVMQ